MYVEEKYGDDGFLKRKFSLVFRAYKI